MAKTNWTVNDIVKPEDMNQIGLEINKNAADIEEMASGFGEHLNDTVQDGEVHGMRVLNGKFQYFDGTNWKTLDSAVISVNGKTGTVVLTAADVGLGNVTNVAQATKTEFNTLNTQVNNHVNQNASSANVHGLGNSRLSLCGLSDASGDAAIAIGWLAKAPKANTIAIGHQATIVEDLDSTGAISIGHYAVTQGIGAIAIGKSAISGRDNTGVLGSYTGAGGPDKWQVPGSFSVNGTKNFEIPHPHPDKKATHVIRHGAVESPTPGDTLYRYTIEATEDGQTVELQLPDYFEHLNVNVDVYVSPHLHFGRAFGWVDEDILKVTCETAGAYKVLVIGTRNDDHPSVQDWCIKGVECEIGESWLGETHSFEVNELIEIEEIKEEVV